MVDAVDAVIAAVRKREPLWNSNNEYHKHVGILKKCWDEVAIETGQDKKKAKTKWKNLRDYYRYELKRIEKKHPTSDNINSTWQWFKPMAFLRLPSDILNKSEASKDPTCLEIKQEGNSWSSYSTLDEDSFVGNLDEISDASIRSSILNPNITYSDPNLNNSQLPPELPRKRLRVESTISENDEPDDDLLFLRSLLSYIKALPRVNRLRLRSKIQDCVLKEVELLEGHFVSELESKADSNNTGL